MQRNNKNDEVITASTFRVKPVTDTEQLLMKFRV